MNNKIKSVMKEITIFSLCIAVYALVANFGFNIGTDIATFWTIVFMVVIPIGAFGVMIAGIKGRSRVGWFLICILFPIALVIVVLLPPVKHQDNSFE